jgi:hypothetical protein
MLTNLLLDLGLTRDSLLWLWGRLAAGAALIASGLVPLDGYVGPGWAKAITIAAVIVLWLAGKYDASPLPGKRGF